MGPKLGVRFAGGGGRGAWRAVGVGVACATDAVQGAYHAIGDAIFTRSPVDVLNVT